MPSIAKMFALLSALLVAACGSNTGVPSTATAVVGTKSIVKYHRSELTAVVTDVTDKLVTTEFTDWNGNLVFTRTEYRGLLAVSGSEPEGGQWELDLDEAQLESLFPLQPGNEITFTANLKMINSGNSYDMFGHVQVLGEKIVELAEGKRKVIVLELSRQYDWGGETRRATDIIYYDPAYSMTLKRVMRQDGAQRFWRVVSVKRPGNAGATTPAPQQRRSGTVMI